MGAGIKGQEQHVLVSAGRIFVPARCLSARFEWTGCLSETGRLLFAGRFIQVVSLVVVENPTRIPNHWTSQHGTLTGKSVNAAAAHGSLKNNLHMVKRQTLCPSRLWLLHKMYVPV